MYRVAVYPDRSVISLSSLLGEDGDILLEREFQILLVANIIVPLGNAVVSPILDSLIDPLGASAATIGLFLSAFTAPGIILIPLLGRLSDRYGRKPLLVIGLVVFGSAGTALALTSDFGVALGLRLLQGFGFAAVAPILIASIGDLYRGGRESTAQGLRFAGSGLTNVVFPLVAGALVGIAWQYPFLLYAIAFPVAAIVFLWFEEPSGNDPEDGRSDLSSDHPQTLRDLLSDTNRLLFILIRGLPAVIWIGFLTYNSIIVVQFLDGSSAHAGLLVAAGSLTAAMGATQAGRTISLFDNQFYPLVITNVGLGGGFVALLFAPSVLWGTIAVLSMGFGFGLMLSIYRSFINGLAPTPLRGSLVSLSEAFGRLMFTATPIVMGYSISAATPRFGFELAVKTVGIGAAVVACGGGVVCLVVADTDFDRYR